MAGQGNAAVFNRARIEQVHQHPLPLLHPNRLPRTESLIVDGVGHRIHFKAVGIGVHHRGLLRLRSAMTVVIIVVHTAGEERFPVAQREKNLLVILPRILPPIDVYEAKLSGVGSAMQIGFGHGVGVVPARSSRTRRKLIAAAATRRDRRRALLLHSIDIGWNQHAVPMHQFRYIRVVDYIHAYGLAFAHPQHRSGRGVVVSDGAQNVVGRELHGNRSDAQGVVGFAGVVVRERVGAGAPIGICCVWASSLAAPACAKAAPPILKKSRRFKRLPPRPDLKKSSHAERERGKHLHGATNYPFSGCVYQTRAGSILVLSRHAR